MERKPLLSKASCVFFSFSKNKGKIDEKCSHYISSARNEFNNYYLWYNNAENAIIK